MLPGISDISSQRGYLQNSYKIDDVVIDHLGAETVPLHTTINAITNSTEQKIDHISLFSPEKKEEISAGTGLLKKLLLGATILTGTGLLVAGGMMCYIAGRSSHAAPLDDTHISNMVMFPSVDHRLMSEVTTRSVTVKAETSRSPYSYYEKIVKTQDKTKPLDQVTMPGLPTVPSVTEKIETTYIHDGMRNIYYDTLPVDMYRPLGKQLYTSLAEYCNSDIQTLVYKGSQASLDEKCKILSKIVEQIDYFKDMDSLLREVNSRRDILSPTEHADEIITRRKLTTAYLAAEYVIDGKDVGVFYNNAMKDHKVYSSEELSNREKRIMDYFPAHHESC